MGAMPLPENHPWLARATAQSPLVRAYTGQPVGARRPIWFMRQAGRSLPEYKKVREGTGMLESCLTPELASEITLQPVRRHDVDRSPAAHLADIEGDERHLGKGRTQRRALSLQLIAQTGERDDRAAGVLDRVDAEVGIAAVGALAVELEPQAQVPLCMRTGLSDVVPVRPFARGVVMVEQIAGLSYVAILVSRVVGLTVLGRRDAP